ncbi:recombination regulator RecX [Antrihabitans stalactiti]|uniref:Regulatory protein RecX n=1 Tax=Antrihabitans stalactiti TaxID=2584121 RepID=A0A848KA47_9NOCA|nr:recombination regulator RecX [Antrihabitans stalactiti]NMN94134.1 recombination regulator RecX [Antrihabitans stalactiti]
MDVSGRGDLWTEESEGARNERPERRGKRSSRSAREPARSEAEGKKPSGTEAQAKDACLRLLTDRARSRTELSQSLAKKGFDSDIAERVLDRLAEVGLVDDASFAEQWVHSRHNYSGKGRQALSMELRRKGIGQEDASRALAQVTHDDERERAAELVRKKLRTVSVPSDRTERDKAVRKLVGMLARRGYGQSMAFEVVKAELAQQGADADGLFEE